MAGAAVVEPLPVPQVAERKPEKERTDAEVPEAEEGEEAAANACGLAPAFLTEHEHQDGPLDPGSPLPNAGAPSAPSATEDEERRDRDDQPATATATQAPGRRLPLFRATAAQTGAGEKARGRASGTSRAGEGG